MPIQPAAKTSAINAAKRKRHLPPANRTTKIKSEPTPANEKNISTSTRPETTATGARKRRRNVSHWPLMRSCVVKAVQSSSSSAPLRHVSEKNRLAWTPTSIRTGAVSNRLAKGTLNNLTGAATPPRPTSKPIPSRVETSPAHHQPLRRFVSQKTGFTSSSRARVAACFASAISSATVRHGAPDNIPSPGRHKRGNRTLAETRNAQLNPCVQRRSEE